MSSTPEMPVLFVGHGTPMNAIEENPWSTGWRALGRALPRPRAILAVSAHWYTRGTFLMGNAEPKTIHDFGGFPRELYEIQYPARGDAALVRRATELIKRAREQYDWGIDHGSWSVLRHLYPDADVPVVQLSIDKDAPPEAHIELGRALAPLRAEGVLIFGSGNITHNLGHAMRFSQDPLPEWAARFDQDITTALTQNDLPFLARALDTETGLRSHPSPDHYLPLLYVAGAAGPSDKASFPISGFDLSSLSMRTVVFGD